MRIVLNARNAKRLEQTRVDMEEAGHQVIAISGDVSNPEDCKALVDQTITQFGRIDYLINNAGISTEGSVQELSSDVFKKVMDVNYLGSVYPTQAAIPHLKKSSGSVVFVSSVAGIRGLPNYAVYSSSKMALTALAESLKIELANDGVHIGIAYVGFTRNDPQKTIYDADGNIVPQPKREFIKPEEPEVVARRIIKMIENRTFKKVFTPLGKLNSLLNRLAPGVVHTVLKNNYQKQQSN